VSHGAAQSLIELQADIVGSALTDAAAQIERMAYTENVRDLARLQAGVLQGARDRIVEDFSRTVTVLKDAAGDARKAVARRAAAAPAAPRKKKAAVRRKRKAKAKVVARKKAPARRAKRASARR
jgi:phasin family protein